jgi:AraC-like DNA-binding protein
LGKIAVAVQQALARRARDGTPGRTSGRVLAAADGWRVEDVICTSGPGDRPFEERHTGVSIAVVAAGTFQYRSPAGRGLLIPGSLLLGSPGQCFECDHAHAAGDRCVAFTYLPEYFQRVTGREIGGGALFRGPRLPPVPAVASLVARACGDLDSSDRGHWEELGVELAGRVTGLADGASAPEAAPRDAEARVTRVVRELERCPGAPLPLPALARQAGLSLFHFLRTFRRLTGVTPHQLRLRLRLRDAALGLRSGQGRVIEVALESGFGDLSTFNHAFRKEFGLGPRDYRRLTRRAWLVPRRSAR